MVPVATIALLLCLLGWFQIGQARLALREALLERARSEAPWAAEFLAQAPPGWVPMPWQDDRGDLLAAIAEAAHLNAAALAGTEIVGVKEAAGFAEAATRWHQQVRLCKNAPQGDIRFQRECQSVHGPLLPADWRAHFARAFAAEYYLSQEANGPVDARSRPRLVTTICNAAPYEVRVGGLINVASEHAVRTQFELLGVNTQPLAVEPPRKVAPGACERRTIRAYDGTGLARFASDAVNPALVAWLQQELEKQHPERVAGPAPQLEQIGTTLPCNAPRGSAERVIASAFCRTGREAVLLSAAYRSQGSSASWHVVSDPLYYAVPPQSASDGGVRPAFERMRPALAHIRDFGRIVETQFSLETKWRDGASAFTLGGILRDDNTMLGEGVHITALPRRSIWNEVVTLPAEGEIVQINGRPIFSIWDIYEALAAHGNSLSFGVHVPISLVYRQQGPRGVRYVEGKVRVLFDTSVMQSFDTTIPAWWLGLKSGLFARWYVGACFVTEGIKTLLNVFGADLRVLPVNQCAWLVNQQIAYVMQIRPKVFAFFEEAGKFVAIYILTRGLGAIGFETRVALAQTDAAFAYLQSAAWLRATAVKSSLDGLWAMGMQPPSTPVENRLYTFTRVAGRGFVQSAFETGFKQALR